MGSTSLLEPTVADTLELSLVDGVTTLADVLLLFTVDGVSVVLEVGCFLFMGAVCC